MIQEVFIVPQRPIQDDTVTEGGCDTKNLMGVPQSFIPISLILPWVIPY